MKNLALAAAAVTALAAAISAPQDRAEARIVCDGPYQIIQGSPHATPYCEDNYLAAVARGYGLRVSSAAVRNNPSVKAEVCRTVGYDSRVREICANYLPGDRGRMFVPF
jgi:hypothetical protein